MAPKTKCRQGSNWTRRSIKVGLSSVGKFTDWPAKEVMFNKIGVPMELSQTLGVIEVAIMLVFLSLRKSFLGAILVTGYLGGAVWTHLRVGDPSCFPIIIGVVMWVAHGLRHPAIFALAMGKSLSPTDSGTVQS